MDTRVSIGAPLPAGVTVRQVVVDGRRLITIQPDADEWQAKSIVGSTSEGFEGALVRLRPPANATDGQIHELEAACRRAGAAAVKVDARVHADAPPREGELECITPRPRVFAECLEMEFETQLLGLDLTARDETIDLVREAIDRGAASAKPAIIPTATQPLYVTRIQANNWFRFRSIDIELRPTVYAVVARDHDDPERSNWVGKSTFAATIAYALTGWHPADYDDAWITKGQDAGGVTLTLSDGTIIGRSKRRGAATKVFATLDGREHTGDEARAAIPRHIGLTEADYFASAFVRQKELARLVTGRASETMKIVGAWLELGALKAAHQDVMGRLACVAEAEMRAVERGCAAEQKLIELQREIEPFLGRIPLAERYPDAIAARLRDQHAEARHFEQAIEAHRKVSEQAQLIARAQVEQEQHAAAVKALENVDDYRDATLPSDLARFEEARDRTRAEALIAKERVDEAKRNLDMKKKVAAAEFDGRCPVADIDCPARDKINADRRGAAASLKVATDWYETERKKSLPIYQAADDATTDLRAVERRQAEEKAHRTELARAVERTKPKAVLGNGRSPIYTADDARDVVELSAKFAEVKTAIATLTRLERELGMTGEAALDWQEKRAAAQKELLPLQRAARILGPGGVQASWVRSELAQIERGANAILAETSDELRVSIRWGYPSPTALAQACEGCGSGYPATSRAKTCPKCGALRGPRIEEEVRLELTQRSGAAEDLAGLAVQVAASAWLRTSRGSQWRSCVIDEPFGALDRAHVRELGGHLAGLLAGRHGFLQAFVIAHSASAMDALPSRLVIEGHEDGTSTIAELGAPSSPS